MDISDLAPLIIIVGSIVYSIITNVGKGKQQETAKTTLPGKKEVKLPEILREKYPPQKSNKEIQIKKTKAQENIVTQEKKVKTTSQFVHTPHKVIKTEPVSALKTDNEKEVLAPILDLEDTDEIKKAFIYTEILNRKEY